ncbi:MAG: glucose-6-phosphate dehydrogenase assembly protein OpcA [Bryobacteraceae bacterium]|nr:glucose-6-phosphate dehydrogenase assembly protein OpcA [Bryobacteraceae bacterium]
MPADAPGLLHELDETWRTLGHNQSNAGSGAQSTGVLRACAMTLIVAAAESDDAQELGAMLSGLMQLHPSRTIVLRTCPHRDAVEARTSVQCWMPFGRRQQICGEWIEIFAGTAQFGEVSLLLLGLTVPDLPVVFWVRHTALAHLDALRPVLTLATRVIVDTSEADEPESALAAVRSLAAGTADGVGPHWRLSDLAWCRITRWRKALAGILHDRPAPLTGAIRWAGTMLSMPACYLDAWLRTVYPGLEIDLRSSDPVRPPVDVGRIRVVQLGGPGLDVRLERPTGGTNVVAITDGLQSGLFFPRLDEATLLAEELGIAGRDRLFEAALELARTH